MRSERIKESLILLYSITPCFKEMFLITMYGKKQMELPAFQQKLVLHHAFKQITAEVQL